MTKKPKQSPNIQSEVINKSSYVCQLVCADNQAGVSALDNALSAGASIQRVCYQENEHLLASCAEYQDIPRQKVEV